MESFEIPETPESREAAKCGQHAAVSRLKALTDRFAESDYWFNCLEQLDEAVAVLKTATVGVELADLAEEGEE